MNEMRKLMETLDSIEGEELVNLDIEGRTTPGWAAVIHYNDDEETDYYHGGPFFRSNNKTLVMKKLNARIRKRFREEPGAQTYVTHTKGTLVWTLHMPYLGFRDSPEDETTITYSVEPCKIRIKDKDED